MLRKLEERKQAEAIAKFLAKKQNRTKEFSIMDIAREVSREEDYPQIRYVVLQMEKGGLIKTNKSLHKNVRMSVKASPRLKKEGILAIRKAV